MLSNYLKVSVKDVSSSKVADLRSSGFSNIAKLWLLNLLNINSLIGF